MNWSAITAVLAGVSLGIGVALARDATAEDRPLRDQLIGTWTAISVDNILPDGRRIQSFGRNPSGVLMLDQDGRFSLLLIRSDLPKFGSGARDSGTAEENKEVVQGTLANFGTYSVSEADRMLVLNVENSSFPNWKGTSQKRVITRITPDELRWQNPAASVGGVAQIIWRRPKERATPGLTSSVDSAGGPLRQ